MTTYNTGNPLGSPAAKDLYDNAQNYDFALNSLTQAIWLDRFGVGRRSWYGLEVMVANAAASYGITTLSGVSFTTGATVNLNEALLNTANNTYYKWTGSFPIGGKVVPINSTPDSTGGIGPGKWLSVGDTVLRSQITDPDGADKYPELQIARWRDVGDIRGWGSFSPGDDMRSIIQTAYNECNGRLFIPAGVHRIKMIDALDPYKSLTYPHGIICNRANVEIVFETGASIYVDPITDPANLGRYNIIDFRKAHNNKIFGAKIIGDRDGHFNNGGEQGYGIRNKDSSNLIIRDWDISKCWGDSVLWWVDDETISGGLIQNGHASYNWRQGISVISCNGLHIDNISGDNISGDTAFGPWAVVDVEPDVAIERIVGLSITNIKGTDNKGPAVLVAIQNLETTSTPIDINIDGVSAVRCQHTVKVRNDKGPNGSVFISNILGDHSSWQDIRIENWSKNTRLDIDTVSSVNCNTRNELSSPEGVVIKVQATDSVVVGNIKIDNVYMKNDETNLTHPMALTVASSGVISAVNIPNWQFDQTVFSIPQIHNPANATIYTSNLFERDFTTSSSVDNTRWANLITNKGATASVGVTIPAGYGFDGMEITARCTSSNQIGVTFADGLEGYTTDVRCTTPNATAVFRKSGGTWFLQGANSNAWSQGGLGRYTYNIDMGGTTAARPANPKPWQMYFDTTLGYTVVFRQDTSTWVKISG
jgi:hypothetical protein